MLLEHGASIGAEDNQGGTRNVVRRVGLTRMAPIRVVAGVSFRALVYREGPETERQQRGSDKQVDHGNSA